MIPDYNEFNLPRQYCSGMPVTIGYPTPNAKPYAPWHDVFLPLSDTVKYL